MTILTGIVFVTDAAETRLVDVRPNATSTAQKIALLFEFIVAIPPGIVVVCGYLFVRGLRRVPFDIVREQARGLEQAVCQGLALVAL
jgi:hypothetical protein